MKLSTVQAAFGSAALLMLAEPASATIGHRHHHLSKRRGHDHTHSAREADSVEERSMLGCKFPDADGLVAVTKNAMNAGWAMSPDQPCMPGTYCPYACPSGQVMAQWKKGSTYATTERMAGGLFCGLDGKITKPFTDKPLCVNGVGSVKAVNKVGKVTSFCQTVLPGNEDMIIPNDVFAELTLAVPDPSYWDSTASHFYINPPGVSSDEGCHWGDDSKPVGNWAPYVAGANTDKDGSTFVKLGLNPIWQGSSLFDTKPSFGLKIECEGGGCNGLPCSIDGNGVTSNNKATGAGGSDFCVVTVPKGGSANIVVQNLDGSSSDAPKTKTTTSATPTTTTSTSTSAESTTSPTSEPTTSTTLTSASTTPTTSSTSSLTSSTSSEKATIPNSSSIAPSTTSFIESSSATGSSAASAVSLAYKVHALGGIFQVNETTTSAFSSSGPSTTSTPTLTPAPTSEEEGTAAPSESAKSESNSPMQGGSAVVGLIVAFVAAVCML